jgi:Fe-S-cluster-containing dehydrogenase component
MKIVTMNPDLCVGCRNCEMACAFARTKETCESKESNIKVNHYIDERILIPMTCLHCSEAWCMEVCPAGAISRDEKTNAVLIDKDKCAGCKMCILACPYGNIHFDSVDLISRKCDLCGGDPKCVTHCIAGALEFVEEEKAFDFRRKEADVRIKSILKKTK